MFYGSVTRKDLCNNIRFDLPIQLLGLIKIILRKTYIMCRIGKHVSAASFNNVLKLGGVLIPLLLKFATQNATPNSKVEVNEEKSRLNGTQRLVV
jgi:hypothetical protein